MIFFVKTSVPACLPIKIWCYISSSIPAVDLCHTSFPVLQFLPVITAKLRQKWHKQKQRGIDWCNGGSKDPRWVSFLSALVNMITNTKKHHLQLCCYTWSLRSFTKTPVWKSVDQINEGRRRKCRFFSKIPPMKQETASSQILILILIMFIMKNQEGSDQNTTLRRWHTG